jgi:hypothetical protein
MVVRISLKHKLHAKKIMMVFVEKYRIPPTSAPLDGLENMSMKRGRSNSSTARDSAVFEKQYASHALDADVVTCTEGSWITGVPRLTPGADTYEESKGTRILDKKPERSFSRSAETSRESQVILS